MIPQTIHLHIIYYIDNTIFLNIEVSFFEEEILSKKRWER